MQLSKLRASSGDVLDCLKRNICQGRDQISLLSLALESGHTLPTVQQAIRQLESDCYIQVKRGGPRRASRYALISDERRRTLLIAQVFGLIGG